MAVRIVLLCGVCRHATAELDGDVGGNPLFRCTHCQSKFIYDKASLILALDSLNARSLTAAESTGWACRECGSVLFHRDAVGVAGDG